MGKTLKVPSEHLQRSIVQSSTSVSRRLKKNYAKNVNRLSTRVTPAPLI